MRLRTAVHLYPKSRKQDLVNTQKFSHLCAHKKPSSWTNTQNSIFYIICLMEQAPFLVRSWCIWSFEETLLPLRWVPWASRRGFSFYHAWCPSRPAVLPGQLCSYPKSCSLGFAAYIAYEINTFSQRGRKVRTVPEVKSTYCPHRGPEFSLGPHSSRAIWCSSLWGYSTHMHRPMQLKVIKLIFSKKELQSSCESRVRYLKCWGGKNSTNLGSVSQQMVHQKSRSIKSQNPSNVKVHQKSRPIKSQGYLHKDF